MPPSMGAAFYRSAKGVGAALKGLCIREVVLGRERAERGGPLILACTHLSHLEPFIISSALRRPVRWMARSEFYRRRWAAWALQQGGAFPVDRAGDALPAVRRAVRLLRAGEVVGMFPEGGVARGDASVLRGGPIKGGVCTIAIAAHVPVVPVVVLGTAVLSGVGGWLPGRWSRVWIAYGEDVPPPAVRRKEGERWNAVTRRAARAEMSDRLAAAFVRTYEGLIAEAGVSERRAMVTDAAPRRVG